MSLLISFADGDKNVIEARALPLLHMADCQQIRGRTNLAENIYLPHLPAEYATAAGRRLMAVLSAMTLGGQR